MKWDYMLKNMLIIPGSIVQHSWVEGRGYVTFLWLIVNGF